MIQIAITCRPVDQSSREPTTSCSPNSSLAAARRRVVRNRDGEVTPDKSDGRKIQWNQCGAEIGNEVGIAGKLHAAFESAESGGAHAFASRKQFKFHDRALAHAGEHRGGAVRTGPVGAPTATPPTKADARRAPARASKAPPGRPRSVAPTLSRKTRCVLLPRSPMRSRPSMA
jgi:hypothetical protein